MFKLRSLSKLFYFFLYVTTRFLNHVILSSLAFIFLELLFHQIEQPDCFIILFHHIVSSDRAIILFNQIEQSDRATRLFRHIVSSNCSIKLFHHVIQSDYSVWLFEQGGDLSFAFLSFDFGAHDKLSASNQSQSFE